MEAFLQVLPDLAHCFEKSDWREWIRSKECENSIPHGSHFTDFQKFLVVSALRPDRAASSLNHFICRQLQVNSVYGKPKSFKNLFEQESTAQTPVLFITTQGSDPSEELEEFAKKSLPAEFAF